MTHLNELSDADLGLLVRKIQDCLLKQAKRNPGVHISIKAKESILGKDIVLDEDDFTCCGSDMVYSEFLGIRRYRCTYRPRHPARYVRLSDGEMVREENLDLG